MRRLSSWKPGEGSGSSKQPQQRRSIRPIARMPRQTMLRERRLANEEESDVSDSEEEPSDDECDDSAPNGSEPHLASLLCQSVYRSVMSRCVHGFGAAASEPADDVRTSADVARMSDVVREIVCNSAQRESVEAGSSFIIQGEPSEALYVVLSGAVVLRRRRADGSSRLVSHLGVGDMIGELSFLLGCLPTATASADASSTVELGVLSSEQASLMLEKDPRSMRSLFFAMSAILSERVASTSAALKSSAHSTCRLAGRSAAAPTSGVMHHLKELTAFEAARKFGLDLTHEEDAEDALLVSTECLLSIETHSNIVCRDSPAKLYLFASHLCIAHSTMLVFTQHRAIPLSKVLAVLYRAPRASRDLPTAAPTAGAVRPYKRKARPRGGVGGKSPERAVSHSMTLEGMRQVEVQMEGESMTLSLPAESVDEIVSAIES